MPNYLVSWLIDIEDEVSPVQAAQQALDHIKRPGSIAHVFDVQDKDTGKVVRVDLNDHTQEVLREPTTR